MFKFERFLSLAGEMCARLLFSRKLVSQKSDGELVNEVLTNRNGKYTWVNNNRRITKSKEFTQPYNRELQQSPEFTNNFALEASVKKKLEFFFLFKRRHYWMIFKIRVQHLITNNLPNDS